MILWPGMLGSGLAVWLPGTVHSHSLSYLQLVAGMGWKVPQRPDSSVWAMGFPSSAHFLTIVWPTQAASQLPRAKAETAWSLRGQTWNLPIITQSHQGWRGESRFQFLLGDAVALREHGNGWWPSLESILSHTLYSCYEHDSKLKRKLLEPYLVHKTYKCLLLYRFKTRR